MTSPGSGAVASGPATLTGVKRRLPLGGTAVNDVDLNDIVAAVNARVRRWHPTPAEGAEWAPDVVLGANMLASRLHTRRNSPAGVATFGTEGTAYVVRNDPDVAMLLQLGPYAIPRVG